MIGIAKKVIGGWLDVGGEHYSHLGGGGTENGYASHLSDYTARGGSHSNSETWVEVCCLQSCRIVLLLSVDAVSEGMLQIKNSQCWQAMPGLETNGQEGIKSRLLILKNNGWLY